MAGKIVPETDMFYDDDMTQAESPPKKQQRIKGKATDQPNENPIFEENSQSYDQIDQDLDDYYSSRSIKTQELCDSSTQTYNNVDNERKTDLANQAFGVFVGHELGNLPKFKRRYVMHQIIKLIENHS